MKKTQQLKFLESMRDMSKSSGDDRKAEFWQIAIDGRLALSEKRKAKTAKTKANKAKQQQLF